MAPVLPQHDRFMHRGRPRFLLARNCRIGDQFIILWCEQPDDPAPQKLIRALISEHLGTAGIDIDQSRVAHHYDGVGGPFDQVTEPFLALLQHHVRFLSFGYVGQGVDRPFEDAVGVYRVG